MVIESVEVLSEFPGVIRVIDQENARFHYLLTRNNLFEYGLPMMQWFEEYKILFFVPLPSGMPTVLKVEKT